MSGVSVVRVPILPFGLVNAHLVVINRTVLLVDSGLPGTEKKVKRVLSKMGLSFSDITLIVITHAHVDHAGNASYLRKLSGAPILGHEADLSYYRREKPMTFCATGWFGRLFIKTGLMFQQYEAFEPDIILRDKEALHLSRFGFDGIVRHTPGHTDGSISIELASQEALVGDLVASGILLGGIMCTGHAKKPPFEENAKAVGKSLEELVSRGNKKFYMGHGGPLPAEEVLRHAKKIMS